MRRITFWLAVALIFIVPWENSVTLPGFGTLIRITGLLLMVAWVVTLMFTGSLRRLRPFHLVVYLFLLWNVISIYWSADLDLTIRRLVTYVQLIILMWILWDIFTTRAAVDAGLQAYVLGAYVSIFSLISNYIAGAGSKWDNRFTASGLNENDLGLILAIGIPMAWYLALSLNKGKWTYALKLINFAYVPVALLGIGLTASRASLVSSFPALLFVLSTFIWLKPFSRILIFSILGGGLFFLPYLVPQTSIDRLSTTGSSIANADLGNRTDKWMSGFEEFSKQPLIGVGSGAFPTAAGSGFVAHNTFISVLVEVGLIGFFLFIILWGMAVFYAIRQPKWEARLWLAIVSVWSIGVLTLTWENRKPTWLILSLIVISANLLRQQDEATGDLELPTESDKLLDPLSVRHNKTTYV